MRKILEVRVRTSRLRLSRADAKAYERLDSYDWILFSSKNAAQYFIEDLERRKRSLSGKTRIAAVGEKTAETLKRNEIRVDVVPHRASVKDMVRSLGSIRGKRMLFPRSAIASKDVLRAMRKKGAIVRAIALYTTIPAPLSTTEKKAVLARKYTALGFKSPSGVHGLLSQFNTKEKRLVLFLEAECIGASTARAAKNAGFRLVHDLSI